MLMPHFFNLMIAENHLSKVLHADSILGSENFFRDVVPNAWILVAHILSAIIVISVIIFFIWHPTKKFIQRRRESYDKNIKLAEKDKLEAEKYLIAIKKNKIDNQKNMSELIYQSQKQADQITLEAEKQASIRAKEIYEKAIFDADQIKKNAQQSIRDNVTNLALDIASKIISTNADVETNHKMIDEYLDSLN